jgi:hypothetical protein
VRNFVTFQYFSKAKISPSGRNDSLICHSGHNGKKCVLEMQF